MTDVRFGETYPATTFAPPPSRPGLVVHSFFDATMYQGSAVFDRYVAAETEDERDTLLRDMPEATVVFHELEEREEFFPLAPAGIFDDLPELEGDDREPHDLLGNGARPSVTSQ